MSFVLNLRRNLKLGYSSSVSLVLQSQFTSVRFNSSSTSLTSPKLFISGLSRLTGDEKLKEAFAPYGDLVEAKVIADRNTGRSKGFGFITYNTVEEAEKAREAMNAKFLDGWVIFVDPANPREPRPPRQPEQPQQYFGFTTNKTVGWCG